MSDLNVTLRINADGKVAVTAARQVRDELAGIGGSAEAAGARTEAGMARARRGVESMGQQLGGIRQQILGVAAGLVSLQGLRQVAAIADEMSRLRSQVALVTRSEAELVAVRSALFEVSQRTSTALAVTTQLYTRIARSTADLNLEQSRLLALTETINQTFVVSATPAAAAGNAITQLTQAFAGGVLRAEEFNSIIENSPRLAQALEDGLGVGIGALRRMVNEGQITSEAIIRALESQAETIRREFESMPLTIEQAWTRVANAVGRYIGDADQARGASRRFAEALAVVAENLDAILDAALTLGTVLLAVYGARLIAAAVAYSVELGRQIILARAAASAYAEMGIAAATAGATGLRSLLTLKGALNGLVALFAAWQIGTYLREQFVEVEVAGIRLVTQLAQAWEYLKQSGAIAWEAIKGAAIGAVNLIRTRIADLLASIAGLAGIEVMGVRLLGNTAAAVRQLEAAIRPTASAYDGFLAAKRRIVAESGVEIVKIREIEEAMIADAYARRAAAEATAEQTAAAAGATKVLAENAGAAEAAAAATRDAARAAEEGARAYERFWSAQDQLQGILDDVAAQMGGPSVRAAQQLRDGLVRLAQIEMDLLAIGPLTVENQERIQLAREGLLATFQQTNAGIEESERRLAERSGGAVDEWQRTWLSGIDAVASAFGDWITGGIGSFTNFGRELIRIAQRVVADLIATFARTRILQTLGLGGGMGASGAAMAGTGAGGAGGLMAFLSSAAAPFLFAGGGALLGARGAGSTGGRLAGAITGGALGLGALGFASGAAGALGAGAGVLGAGGALSSGLMGASAALGPVGIALAAAALVNQLAGGRLFGTAWKPTGVGGIDVGFGPAGATGSGFQEESRRRSLFRGTARRTVSTPLDDRAMAELEAAFAQIEAAVTAAAQALRVNLPPVVAGAWKEVRDQSGAIISQTSTVLGRQYSETFEDFQRRLTAESLLAVIDRALGNAVDAAAGAIGEELGVAIGDALKPIGPEIGGLVKSMSEAGVSVSDIAERWRGNAAELLDGAQFLLAAAVDIQRGVGLLGGPESLAGLVDLIEDIAGPTETLIAAYQRAAGATALLDRALQLSGVTLDDTREAVVRFAVGIAEAAGGLDQASRLWERYFEVAFTPLERLQAALAEAESIRDAVLAQAGLGAESTVSEIRGAVEAALAAGSDPEQIVRLLQAADAVGRVNELLAQLADLAGESAGALAAEAEARRQALATYAELASELMREVAALGASDLVRALGEARRAERERINALNDAARAAGMQAAREEDLARAHLLAADAAARAIARARAAAQSIVDDLYGTPLQQIEAQIAAIQGAGGAGGLSAIAAGADEVAGAWQSAIDRIRGWLDDLMTGPLGGLRPRDALAEARRQFDAVLAAARGGDAEAAGRLPQLAEQVLRLGQRVFASGDPYFALRDEVRGALQSIVGLSGPGGGSVGGGAVGVVGAVDNSALAELLRQRDELLAAQEADRRRAQAEELAAYIREIAQVTGELPLAILAGMGVPLDRFAADLGIRLDELTVETTGALAALANRLAVELPELAAGLGVELGALADANSLINDALEAVIRRQPPEIAAALAPLLARLEDALTPEEQAAALAALEEYIGQLAPALRLAFAPFFEGIDPETVDEQIATLSGIRDISAEQLGALGEVREAVLRGIDVAEMIGVDTMVEQRRTTSAVDRAAEAQTGALREVRDAVEVGLGEVVRAIREAMQPVEPVVPEASFAVGTARVPRDMLAQIHRDEAVIDARSMRVLRDYGIRVSGGGNSDAIVAELRQLREERSQADSLSRTLADRIERLERAQRETAAAIERQTAAQRRSFA